MPASLIDGAGIAKQITDDLAVQVKKTGKVPGIAVIRVGNDSASEIYVNKKVAKAAELGFYSEKHELPETTSQEELLQEIDRCNKNPKLHGILVQLPLPHQIDTATIQSAVLPKKDVDGFHPLNQGYLLLGHPRIISATPRGIVTLIKSVHEDLTGKHVVVIGRSAIVGKPTAQLMLLENATVTTCHSKTENLAAITKTADILIVAIGKPKFITALHVKPGATVIDAGIHRIDGKICGDVDFEDVKKTAGAISPVPGGVGPLTIASLMQNTFDAMQHSSRA